MWEDTQKRLKARSAKWQNVWGYTVLITSKLQHGLQWIMRVYQA